MSKACYSSFKWCLHRTKFQLFFILFFVRQRCLDQSESLKGFLMFLRNLSNKMYGLNQCGNSNKINRASLILMNKITVTVMLNKLILLLLNQIKLFIHIIHHWRSLFPKGAQIVFSLFKGFYGSTQLRQLFLSKECQHIWKSWAYNHLY